MGYRIIFISNPCRLSVKQEQLIIDGQSVSKIPLEDIECIVIDNLQSTLSAYMLSKIGEYAITFLVTDSGHVPNGVYLPYARHSRHLSALQGQLAMSEPSKKQLWKQIVIQKIENQANVLKLSGVEDWGAIADIKGQVKSGDTTNMEAVAAAKYFKLLFGNDFSRNQETIINAMLNYGYAILRSTIAKNIVAYGFEPSIGIHHKNSLNNYNLADDLIEPFRPVVDLYVKRRSKDISEFTIKHKTELVNLLNMNVLMDYKSFACARAIELEIKSLSGYLMKHNNKLLLPQLIDLEEHEYE